MPPDHMCAVLTEASVPFYTSDGAFPVSFGEDNLEEGTEVFAIGTCSSKPDDISNALDGIDLEPGDVVNRVIISTPDEKMGQLYIKPGNATSASRSLLMFGTISLLVAVGVGGGLGFAAVKIYLSTR